MNDFLFCVGLVIIGFVAGWKLRVKWAEHVMNLYLKENMKRIQSESEQKKTNTINLDLYREGDFVYVYNEDDGSFITQVKSKEEMIEFIQKNYSEKYVLMKPEQKVVFEGINE